MIAYPHEQGSRTAQHELQPSMRPRRPDIGVTLAEILIGLSLLAVTLLAIVGLQATILKARQKSTLQVHAAKLAAALMLDIEHQLVSDFEADVSVSRSPVPAEMLMDSPYKFEYEVTQSSADPPGEELKDIAVTLYWSDKNGDHRRTIWGKFLKP